MTRRKSAILAIALSLGLVLGACGDDSSPSANEDDQAENGENGEATEGAFSVKLSADGIELPEKVSGGVVEVTLETDFEEPEVNFTKVPDGTTEQALKEAVAKATTGGEIAPVIEATAGITGGTQFLELQPGSYIAWSDTPSQQEQGEGGEGEGEEGEEPSEPAAEGEGEEGEEGGEEDAPNPDSFITKAFTVEGDAGGEIPDTGSITARDYSFDVKLKAGEDKFYFRNEGPDQLHHAVLMDFGTVAPDVVEKNLVPFIQSEGEGDFPAFKDLDPEKIFSVGGSAVFSPGVGGTADAKIESGNTYAVICFLQDRAGGPPHVFGKGMHSVFKAE